MTAYRYFLFLLLFTISAVSHADDKGERVGPTYDVTLDRPVLRALIEGEPYFNVTVELDAAGHTEILTTGVKVTVKDSQTGKKIYKKRFSKSYLYAFSNGTILVGKGNALTQVILTKSDGVWLMEIREKGIY
ncbi:MAG: hypothetical protein IJY31_03585 [Muribaculaceae bacterium]|nr:hypothetical protein [Muribaculaceae bacterium]